MSFIRNLLDSPNGWTQLNRNINEMRGLNSCFYFFGLKTGCKLIAVFEALVNVLQMCSIYKAEMEMEVGLGTTTTESLDSLMVTREPDGDMLGPNTTMPIFETNLYFSKTLHSLTVLRSLLLFVGAEWLSPCNLARLAANHTSDATKNDDDDSALTDTAADTDTATELRLRHYGYGTTATATATATANLSSGSFKSGAGEPRYVYVGMQARD
ncbi:hypothetical protein M5D96_007532 [Drosophila gunungcola]|uniref:Uncharacterized protein n=1 Tax=Drosophila gunungcola TaxID=103775 RepID=A0A9Q0BPS6_9MUSC|nr:hypothetical protein M5D96_007532 [Drosophila gunungcola]